MFNITKLFSFKDKALIFPLIFSLILVIMVFMIAYTSFSGSRINNVSPTPTPSQNKLSVNKILPDEPETLTAGIPHTFLIYFNKNISVKELQFEITRIDVSQDNPKKIIVPIVVSMFSPEVIKIKTANPIEERSEYYVTIINPKNNNVMFTSSYLSGDIQPTKLPTNDQTLKKYLPYQTSNYTLEYVQESNLYIFHFKYDPSLDEDITQQYNDAKDQAIQFIESKGVDINNVIIQYRSS